MVRPGTQLLGATRDRRPSCEIGPDTTLTDVDGRRRRHGDPHPRQLGRRSAPAPPSARSPTCGPGTELGADGKLGAFVETKNADDRRGHQGAAPDATSATPTSASTRNIGASSVFVNYDGETKRRTTIGSHVRTGIRHHVRRAGRRSATARTPARAP